jgi:hypothetical protein
MIEVELNFLYFLRISEGYPSVSFTFPDWRQGGGGDRCQNPEMAAREYTSTTRMPEWLDDHGSDGWWKNELADEKAFNEDFFETS